MWINEKQMAGESIISMAINADLIKDKLSTSDNGETFRHSKRWFHNFKARTGICSIARHGEAASANTRAAENYVHHCESMNTV